MGTLYYAVVEEYTPRKWRFRSFWFFGKDYALAIAVSKLELPVATIAPSEETQLYVIHEYEEWCRVRMLDAHFLPEPNNAMSAEWAAFYRAYANSDRELRIFFFQDQ